MEQSKAPLPGDSMAARLAKAKEAAAGKGTSTGAGVGAPPVAAAPAPVAEQQEPVLGEVVEEGERLYHHRFHGANFVMPKGKVITFLGGTYKTKHPEEIEELNKVANVPGHYIFTTEKPVLGREETAQAKDIISNAEGSFDTVNKIAAGAKTVPMQVSKPQVAVLTEDGPSEIVG